MHEGERERAGRYCIRSENTLFEGNCNMPYYFWPNGTRLGVGMKSVTSGHCVVERMPLRRVSAVAFYKKKRYCPIFHCLWENLWKITKWRRETTVTWAIDIVSVKTVDCKNRKGSVDHMWCVPKGYVWMLLLKNRCRSHCVSTSGCIVSFLITVVVSKGTTSIFSESTSSLAKLLPFCPLCAFISDKHHLASPLVRQPWLSLYLEGPCLPSFSLASKNAYRRRTGLHLRGPATTNLS